MTKKELIEQLGPYEDDMQVILSQDSEGNGFGSMWQVSVQNCKDEGHGRFEMYDEVTGEQAIVLWPST